MPFPVKKGNLRVRRRSPVASSTAAEKKTNSEIRKAIRPPRRSSQRSSYSYATNECQTNSTDTSESFSVHNDLKVSDNCPVAKLHKIENRSLKSKTYSEEKTSLKESKVQKSDVLCKSKNLTKVLPKKSLSDNQENDVKLSPPCNCFVSITSEERMNAEIAIMKLRKGQRNENISDRVSKEDIEDSDSSSSTSEYDDSQSDDDDKSFEPSRTYPFRKKSTTSHKSISSRSFAHVASSNSSADSSSESLPDLDFPITGSWTTTTATVSTSSCKPVLSETSSPGYKKRSLSGNNSTSSCNNGSVISESRLKPAAVMGSTQSKSNEASNSRKPSPIVSRSLRSSDGNHKVSDSAHSMSESPNKHSTRSSPERSSNRSSIEKLATNKPSSVATDHEKSYSLRCLDKKDSKRSSLPGPSTVMTAQQDDNKGAQVISQVDPVPAPVVVQKRGRGRPRKYPLVVPPKSSESSVPASPQPVLTPPVLSTVDNGKSLEKPSTPLTRSQRRAVQPEKSKSSPYKADKKDSSAEESLPSHGLEKKKLHVLKRVDGGVKKSRVRNALAARARQSKMMAKSRVLHSRKRHAESWRGINNKLSKSEESIEEVSDQDLNSPLNQDLSEESSNEKETSEELEATEHNSECTSNGKWNCDTKEVAKAKCDVCNITFTRRFSLTKHLNTRQHHKKAQLHRLGLTSKDGRIKRLVGRPRLRKNTPAVLSTVKLASTYAVEQQVTERYNISETDAIAANEDGISRIAEDFDRIENYNEFGNGCNDDDHQDFDDDEDDDGSSSQEPEAWSSGKVLGKNDFECEVCDEKFTNKFEFASHIWNHRQDSNLTCSVCDMKFTDSDAFNIHIDGSHLDTTKYNCSICPSKFSREDYLKKHEAFHKLSQSERFRCTICEKRLGSQDSLQRHRELRHFVPSKNSHFGKMRKWRNHSVNSRLTPKLPEYISFDEPPGFPNDNDDHSMGSYLDGTPVRMTGVSNPRREEEEESRPTEVPNKYDIIPLIAPEDYGREIPVEIYNPRAGTNSHGHSNAFPLDMESFGVPSDYNRTISMGCGYKTAVVNNKDFKFNSLQCTDCRKVFQNRRSLYNHCKYFTQGERHACHTCKKIFKFKHHLNRHMLRHTMQKDSTSKSLIAIRKPSFFKHRKMSGTHRNIPKLMPIVSQQLNPIENLSLSSTGVLSTSSSFLLEDIPQSNGHSSPTEGLFKPNSIGILPDGSPIPAGESSSSVLTKQNTVSKTWNVKLSYKQHSCELCSKTFTEKKTLDVHMYYHQKENLLSCPDCEAKCERKNDLELHFRCHVKRTPFFLCYVCFKPFRWKKDMVRHVRKKHPEERTYRCLYCQDKFRTSEDLTCHVADSHPEHRSFPCDYCGRRYAQKRYLILHIQNQHGHANSSGMVMMMSPSNVCRDEDNDDGMDLGDDFEVEDGVIDELAVADINEDEEDASLNQSSLDDEHSYNLSLSKLEHHL